MKMTLEKKAELDAALQSGDPLKAEQLAYHLGVDPKNVPRIAEAFGLKPEGRIYPWRRVWWQIHGTDGIQLANHLAVLNAKYPDSVILGGITDLEAELRKPLVDFAMMAERRGWKPDTLSKALREGRATLPFPMIDMGPRTRHFRALEVRLWVAEEITLDLPEPPEWSAAGNTTNTNRNEDAPATAAVKPNHDNCADSAPDTAKKAIFGAFGTPNRNSPT